MNERGLPRSSSYWGRFGLVSQATYVHDSAGRLAEVRVTSGRSNV